MLNIAIWQRNAFHMKWLEVNSKQKTQKKKSEILKICPTLEFCLGGENIVIRLLWLY